MDDPDHGVKVDIKSRDNLSMNRSSRPRAASPMRISARPRPSLERITNRLRPRLRRQRINQNHPAVTPADLAKLAAAGQLRYVYWDARGRGRFGQQPNIASWLTQNCRVVPGFEADTSNSGAPGGIGAAGAAGTNQPGLGANLLVSLYDCAP